MFTFAMSKAKCRLCLCPTASQPGVPSSIEDDCFEAIIKNVFRFALPTFHIVAGVKTDLPLLVCFQCSNIVRNFHYFSEHVIANQKKLHDKWDENRHMPQPQPPISDNGSMDNLIQEIKRGSEEAITNSLGTKDNEYDSTSTINKKSGSEFGGNPSGSEPSEPQKCVAKVELVETLEKMDKRVDAVTKQLGVLIQKLAQSRPISKKRSIDFGVSFHMKPITNVEELDTFNQQLNDEEYKEKVLNWLGENVTATDNDNRMQQTLDLIFSRAFLPEFSWTGKSRVGKQKLAFRNYTNILDVLQTIGKTDTSIVTDRELEYFLQKKLNHAKDRVNILGYTSCHVDPKKRKK
uniref:ZAD domain-containing protein n=1 Tax=Anopheles atroparvus TaxID=41427 RepID=A0AAG5DED5_ANOAO